MQETDDGVTAEIRDRASGEVRTVRARYVQPDGAQQLERAQLEVPGARVDRGAAVALDRQRRDAVMGEEQRRGQAHEASAHDQDRDLLVTHGGTVPQCWGA